MFNRIIGLSQLLVAIAGLIVSLIALHRGHM